MIQLQDFYLHKCAFLNILEYDFNLDLSSIKTLCAFENKIMDERKIATNSALLLESPSNYNKYVEADQYIEFAYGSYYIENELMNRIFRNGILNAVISLLETRIRELCQLVYSNGLTNKKFESYKGNSDFLKSKGFIAEILSSKSDRFIDLMDSFGIYVLVRNIFIHYLGNVQQKHKDKLILVDGLKLINNESLLIIESHIFFEKLLIEVKILYIELLSILDDLFFINQIKI